MIRLVKFLIFGHFHRWDEELRESTKLQDGGLLELKVYEKCHCGKCRVRMVKDPRASDKSRRLFGGAR